MLFRLPQASVAAKKTRDRNVFRSTKTVWDAQRIGIQKVGLLIAVCRLIQQRFPFVEPGF